MADRDNEFKLRIESQLAHSKNNDAAKNALALLFPKAERVIHTYIPSSVGDIRTQKTGRRISQRDFAEAYFSLNPDPATWGRSEFESLIDKDPKVAFAALDERVRSAPLKHRPRLRRLFLELLDAEFSNNKRLTQAWLDEILAQSPNLLSEKDTIMKVMFPIDNEDRLQWLIVNALEKLSQTERSQFLTAAIQRAKDVTVLTDVVRGIVGDMNPEGAQDRNNKSDLGVEADRVRSALLDRIRALGRSGKLWSQSRPARLLWFWWGCDLQTEVFEFTKRAIRKRRALISLLDAPVQTVNSSEGTFEKVDKKSWSKIVDLEMLADRARRLAQSTKDESERNAAFRFLNALAKDGDS